MSLAYSAAVDKTTIQEFSFKPMFVLSLWLCVCWQVRPNSPLNSFIFKESTLSLLSNTEVHLAACPSSKNPQMAWVHWVSCQTPVAIQHSVCCGGWGRAAVNWFWQPTVHYLSASYWLVLGVLKKLHRKDTKQEYCCDLPSQMRDCRLFWFVSDWL